MASQDDTQKVPLSIAETSSPGGSAKIREMLQRLQQIVVESQDLRLQLFTMVRTSDRFEMNIKRQLEDPTVSKMWEVVEHILASQQGKLHDMKSVVVDDDDDHNNNVPVTTKCINPTFSSLIEDSKWKPLNSQMGAILDQLEQNVVESGDLLKELISMAQLEKDFQWEYKLMASRLCAHVQKIFDALKKDLSSGISSSIAESPSKPPSPALTPSPGGSEKIREILQRLQQIAIESPHLRIQLFSMLQIDDFVDMHIWTELEKCEIREMWELVDQILAAQSNNVDSTCSSSPSIPPQMPFLKWVGSNLFEEWLSKPKSPQIRSIVGRLVQNLVESRDLVNELFSMAQTNARLKMDIKVRWIWEDVERTLFRLKEDLNLGISSSIAESLSKPPSPWTPSAKIRAILQVLQKIMIESRDLRFQLFTMARISDRFEMNIRRQLEDPTVSKMWEVVEQILASQQGKLHDMKSIDDDDDHNNNVDSTSSSSSPGPFNLNVPIITIRRKTWKEKFLCEQEKPKLTECDPAFSSLIQESMWKPQSPLMGEILDRLEQNVVECEYLLDEFFFMDRTNNQLKDDNGQRWTAESMVSQICEHVQKIFNALKKDLSFDLSSSVTESPSTEPPSPLISSPSGSEKVKEILQRLQQIVTESGHLRIQLFSVLQIDDWIDMHIWRELEGHNVKAMWNLVEKILAAQGNNVESMCSSLPSPDRYTCISGSERRNIIKEWLSKPRSPQIRSIVDRLEQNLVESRDLMSELLCMTQAVVRVKMDIRLRLTWVPAEQTLLGLKEDLSLGISSSIAESLSKPPSPLTPSAKIRAILQLLQEIVIESRDLQSQLFSMLQTDDREDKDIRRQLEEPAVSKMWEVVEHIVASQQGKLHDMKSTDDDDDHNNNVDSTSSSSSPRPFNLNVPITTRPFYPTFSSFMEESEYDIQWKPQNPQTAVILDRLEQNVVESRDLLEELFSMAQTDPQLKMDIQRWLDNPLVSQIWRYVEHIFRELKSILGGWCMQAGYIAPPTFGDELNSDKFKVKTFIKKVKPPEEPAAQN